MITVGNLSLTTTASIIVPARVLAIENGLRKSQPLWFLLGRIWEIQLCQTYQSTIPAQPAQTVTDPPQS